LELDTINHGSVSLFVIFLDFHDLVFVCMVFLRC
jgi:hypothetical protein